MGGNEWAAWAKPAAARKQLINAILKIKVPLIFTFRAREKTKQEGKKVINIGWQPVAPLEIVHTLDMTCILPPRADGVPVWKSDKIGEDFIIKLPNYLAPYIEQGKPLDERMGAAFARWARGDTVSPRLDMPAVNSAGPALSPSNPAAGPADDVPTAAEYFTSWNTIILGATNADQLAATWSEQVPLRKRIAWDDEYDWRALQTRVRKAIESMRAPA